MGYYRVYVTTKTGESTSIEVEAPNFKSALKKGENWEPGNVVTDMIKFNHQLNAWHTMNFAYSKLRGKEWVYKGWTL